MPRVDRVPHFVGFLTPNSSDDALSVVMPKFITVLSTLRSRDSRVGEYLQDHPLETARNSLSRVKISGMPMKSNLFLACASAHAEFQARPFLTPLRHPHPRSFILSAMLPSDSPSPRPDLRWCSNSAHFRHFAWRSQHASRATANFAGRGRSAGQVLASVVREGRVLSPHLLENRDLGLMRPTSRRCLPICIHRAQPLPLRSKGRPAWPSLRRAA